ncbi:sugar 3,4-ketoisomerase [Oceanotoga teriensis]|uniref:sugar 3,4-ketoisomerase n=1 Tax=Oceanotoga teriensis TaxID=515440 RepID=UPI002713A25D|nr:FdtA/QdtA family cupin domain-containing protein [Oceanotoga teriensis]MDO7975853.1 FdtA/QdtA family cupin domain-containing protein [Oceanotoga teriensis]
MNKIIEIKTFGNEEQGFLSFFESNKDIPFEIKRIYYTYDVPINTKRGMHAHKELNQVLWCPYGEIEVILDNGKEKKSYLLDSPEKALLVGKGIWRDMYWKKENSVLCVAASDYYNEEDYIRDYDEFLKYVKEGYWNDENKLY